MEQTELDLREIFLILRRRFWLIVAIPVLAALTAGLVSLFLLEPVYSASTTLWVIKDGAQINYTELMLNRSLTKTYAEVAKSRAVMAEVISNLQLRDVTVQGLQAKLTVNPVRDTEILSFTVEDGSPTMAAKLADGVAEAFRARVLTTMKVDNVVVVDQAIVPGSPIRPRKVMNVAIAVVLGGMAAVGLAFLLEYLDTTVKSPDDVSRHLGLPVLGLIPVIEPAEAPVTVARSRVRSSKEKMVVEE